VCALGPLFTNASRCFDYLAGVRRRQCNGCDLSLPRGIFQVPSAFGVCALHYRQLGWCSFRLSHRRYGLLSEALNSLPDALGRRLPVGKLGAGFAPARPFQISTSRLLSGPIRLPMCP
jgi:hypothetical protein